ncbi:peptidoglycan-binding protein [Streptomyces rimosus]|uniref:peptidoglycan-binding domain-containing protein n=1 Tax=Streptomyces rimosus TaxID=1927 RepID=UPI0004CB5587|nr:peptidoglycan-binding domain-containing protein [Streptomyces rimosus]
MSIRKRGALLAGAVLLGGSSLIAAAPATTAAPATAPVAPAVAASCNVHWRVSTNYHGYTAGYSWAWNDTVYPGASGDRVREIQCLAKYWGSDPGPIDGVFGSKTEKAVREQQKACNIAADGIVGPKTWRCLRAGGHN